MSLRSRLQKLKEQVGEKVCPVCLGKQGTCFLEYYGNEAPPWPEPCAACGESPFVIEIPLGEEPCV